MPSPQLENGHTRIANELLEKVLQAGLTRRETNVFWAVVRLTYGWRKKEDRMSYQQIAEVAQINRRHVQTTVTNLVLRRILHRTPAGRTQVIGINKDYSQWVPKEDQNGPSRTKLSRKEDQVGLTTQDQVGHPPKKGKKEPKKIYVPVGKPQYAEAEDLLAFLNTRAGRQFKPYRGNKPTASLELCRRVLKTMPALTARRIIIVMSEKWKDNPDMRDYLCPTTLFGRKTKIDNYLTLVEERFGGDE